MRSSDVLVNERIIIDLQGKDKYEVLEKLVKMTKASGRVSDEAKPLQEGNRTGEDQGAQGSAVGSVK